MQAGRASLENLEGVARLFDGYRVFYKQEPDLDAARNYIEQRLENEDSVIFVVTDGEDYLGFTQLYPMFSSVSMKRLWILNDLYVAAEARKRGVGEMLMEKAKEFALETGAKSLNLSTAFDNHSAQRLYEKLGYRRDDEFYSYELLL
ncbi:GNAT family N-acetyltransferase [Planomicrobium sp. CPCC 101079]|uniref:GNAT family N-acetyltransferase n=1 Tax=Planomicrobium sp. CPCC 101079 TaxID=2599618 RepID=UPI0011B5382E|nr:GNAT family N-acetyltransferase [Planomicrobium sp. CPCC 101079]TWT13335.1 GNAT family N-acetyltransferase [Planomicrobium sp. CPCC 101079]